MKNTKKSENYYAGERPELARFLPSKYSRVLEIGCGDGSFRKLLPNCTEYWGVEPVEEAAKQARNQLTRVLQGTLNHVADELPEDYFDLIICNDVIEHIADTDQALTSLRKKLKRNSCLVGSVPNVRYYKNLFKILILKDWRYTDKGILDSTHVRFFTKRSLRRTLTENGFQIEKFKCINGAVYLKKKTAGNLLKYLSRFVGFLLLDICTFGHSSDIKYAQFAFRCTRT